MFYKDVGPDTDDAKSGPNSGLFNRSLATERGKVVDLEGSLLMDVFQQPKLLLNGVSIGIKLWPSRLVTDTPKADLKVQIVDASFRLCVQQIDGGLMMAHEKMIKMEPAIYPYLKSDIKTTSIASGQYSFSVDDVFQGLVPCKLIVGLVSSAAYMGTRSTFEITTVVRWDSTSMVSLTPHNPFAPTTRPIST